MKAKVEDTDGSRCFAHGVAHLLSDFGYEEGLALAGTVLLEMRRSEDTEQWSASDSPGIVRAVEGAKWRASVANGRWGPARRSTVS